MLDFIKYLFNSSSFKTFIKTIASSLLLLLTLLFRRRLKLIFSSIHIVYSLTLKLSIASDIKFSKLFSYMISKIRRMYTKRLSSSSFPSIHLMNSRFILLYAGFTIPLKILSKNSTNSLSFFSIALEINS